MDVDEAEPLLVTQSCGTHQSLTAGKPAKFFILRADECLSNFPPNFELSLRWLEKGLYVHPKDPELLERLAGEYAERGKFDESKQLLEVAIENQPSTGASKFLQLAQIEEGEGSLRWYQKGIEILECELTAQQENPQLRKECFTHQSAVENPTLRSTGAAEMLASAYCSVAELFLTDLCEVEDAELRVEEALKRAFALQPNSPEALLCQAQLKKVTDDAIGACEAARRLFEVLRENEARCIKDWLTPGADGSVTDVPLVVGPHEGRVSIETRVNASRILVDVGMIQESLEILKSCLNEDDEDPQIWLIFACALFKNKKLKSARAALMNLKKCLERSGLPEDNAIVQHQRELSAQVEEGLSRVNHSQIHQESSQMRIDEGRNSNTHTNSSDISDEEAGNDTSDSDGVA